VVEVCREEGITGGCVMWSYLGCCIADGCMASGLNSGVFGGKVVCWVLALAWCRCRCLQGRLTFHHQRLWWHNPLQTCAMQHRVTE
jgi:hypothetical protein